MNQQSQLKQSDQSLDQITEKKIKRKVIILSLFYFFVTVGASSFFNIMIYMHQKYKHKGYGQTYVTANSLTSIITYIFCPFIIEKAKNKSRLLLFLCVFGYFLNIFMLTIFSYIEDSHMESQQNMPPPTTIRFILQILANMIGGAASGMFWVLNGIYMANYCRNLAENKKGFYFSLSSVVFNARLIIAPILTIVGLGLGNQTFYFSMLSLLVLITLPVPLKFIEQIDLTQTKTTLNIKIQQQSQEIAYSTQKKKQNICKYLLQFLYYFRKIVYILPCSIIAGLVVGFVASSLSHLLPKPSPGQSNDTKVAIALIFFGFGNILGGYLSGYLCDKLSVKAAGYLGSCFVIFGSVVEAIFLSIDKNVQRSSIVGFLSGLSYSYLFSYVSIICTIHYKGESFSFATNRQSTSLSYIAYQWFVALINNNCNMKLNMTYQGLALIPLAILSAFCIRIQCRNYNKRQKIDQTSNIEIKQQKINAQIDKSQN